MDRELLLAPMKNSMGYIQLMDSIKKEKTPVILYGLNETQKSHIIYGIHNELERQICVVTYNDTNSTFTLLSFKNSDNLAALSSVPGTNTIL